MVTPILYVEGGGDGKALRSECREGFRRFLEKAGKVGKMPRIVASGSRQSAYNDYCTARQNKQAAMLLVDSEEPIMQQYQSGDDPQSWQPWQHLWQRDQWQMPSEGSNLECHLMVQVMESWFLADHKTLTEYFGQGFNVRKLPPAQNPIEAISKEQVYTALEMATRDCKTKGQYSKGAHSFALLAQIDPNQVAQQCAWARRFLQAI